MSLKAKSISGDSLFKSTKNALSKHAQSHAQWTMLFNFGTLQKLFENGTYVVIRLKNNAFCPFLAV
jgi:hypothetical protein